MCHALFAATTVTLWLLISENSVNFLRGYFKEIRHYPRNIKFDCFKRQFGIALNTLSGKSSMCHETNHITGKP